MLNDLTRTLSAWFAALHVMTILPGLLAAQEPADAKPGKLYELRIYTANPGKLPDLHARFRDHTMRLFEKHGMKNIVYTTPIAEPQKSNTLVYVLAHKDRAAADASWKAFVSDPEWKKVAAESQTDGPLLAKDGVVRMYLTPTDFSPVK